MSQLLASSLITPNGGAFCTAFGLQKGLVNGNICYFKSNVLKNIQMINSKPKPNDYFESEIEGNKQSTRSKGLTWKQEYERDLRLWKDKQQPSNKIKCFTKDEVKSLIFNGTEKRNGKISLTDDKRSLDWVFMRMFDLLEEKTIFNRVDVEKLFWERITALVNHQCPK